MRSTHSAFSRKHVEVLESRTHLSAVLYASDANGLLYAVNTGSHVTAVVGNMGVAMNDLAFSPAGALFGVDEQSNLFQIDPTTAVIHEIGPLGIHVVGLVFSSTGILYTANDSLYTLNTVTAAPSFVQSFGGFAAAGDIAFDANGNLFVSAASNELLKVNLASKVVTDVGPIGFSEVYGIGFGLDGVMYGISNSADEVISFNLLTGAGTAVSPITGVAGVHGADAAPLSILPQAPVNLQASQGTFSDHVHITWNSTSGAQSYNVWRNTTNDFVSATQFPIDIVSTAFDDTTAQSRINYYYWVVAKTQLTIGIAAGPVIGYQSRSEPYLLSFRVFSKSMEVTTQAVPVGKPLRLVLSVYNPTTAMQKVRVLLGISSTQGTGGFDYVPILKQARSNATISINYSFTPTTSGTFTADYTIQTSIHGHYITTDVKSLPAASVADAGGSRLSITTIENNSLIQGTALKVGNAIPVTPTLRVHNKLALFLTVEHSVEGSAAAAPAGTVGNLLAKIGIIPPEGDIYFSSRFAKSNDRVTVNVTLDLTSGSLNILDIILAQRLKVISLTDVQTVLQDIERFFQPAYEDLVHPKSSSQAEQVLQLISDLRAFLNQKDEVKLLVKDLGKMGFKVTAKQLEHLLTIDRIYTFAKQLVSIAALNGQLLSGIPMQITFTAQAYHH